MSDDPNTPPIPAAAARRSPIVCQFCDCELTPHGDALRVSERARGFQKLDDKIDTLKRDRDQIAGELEAAKAEIARLRPAAPAADSGLPWPV